VTSLLVDEYAFHLVFPRATPCCTSQNKNLEVQFLTRDLAFVVPEQIAGEKLRFALEVWEISHSGRGKLRGR
jgi:hypothetical protein